MIFKQPLLQATFQRRYKRFFADVELSSKTEIAHVANTGSMKSCILPGQPCLISRAENPERKLRFSLEAIKAPSGSWVGVNTSYPNKLIKEAFDQGLFSHWKEFDHFQAEVKLSAATRIDAVLSKDEKKHFIEVKNVTLAEDDQGRLVARFPDAVTERGQKHLRELISLVKQGHSAEIFFTVQRDDCEEFQPADEIDPEYGRLLRQAAKAGVIISAYKVKISAREIVLTNEKLKVQL